ncbi:MAG: alpha/beta hydrolase [Cellvibrionales bacterium]|nr:alpha/beta hydrolase [Cellvibrionales bacterium]
MQIHELQDENGSFKVAVKKAEVENPPTILFCAGLGGLPERYSTLIHALVNERCTVIAPYFEPLARPFPTKEELVNRANRISIALDALNKSPDEAIGIGHSIGASVLIGMSGAKMQLFTGKKVAFKTENRLSALVVLAAPTQFFLSPGSLDLVSIPIMGWVGANDKVTPPDQLDGFMSAIPLVKSSQFHVDESAGHFSFLDQPPPNIIETVTCKSQFIQKCSHEIGKFVIQHHKIDPAKK